MASVGAKVRELVLTQGQQETIEAARAERAPAASPPLPQRSIPGSLWLACPPWPTRKVRVPGLSQEGGRCRACAAASTRPNSEGRPDPAELVPCPPSKAGGEIAPRGRLTVRQLLGSGDPAQRREAGGGGPVGCLALPRSRCPFTRLSPGPPCTSLSP